MPRINLLPWRAAERKRRQQQVMIAAVAAIGAACVVTGLLYLMVGGWIDAQEGRNQLLKTQIAELDKQITEINGLEEQKRRLLARMEVIEKLQRSRPEVVHLFDQLVRTLPDGVYLTSVKQTDKKLELKGMAQSSTRVSAFMRNIDASTYMTNPTLDVVEASAQGSSFTLYADQVGVRVPAEDQQ